MIAYKSGKEIIKSSEIQNLNPVHKEVNRKYVTVKKQKEIAA